jgi:LemA protein
VVQGFFSELLNVESFVSMIWILLAALAFFWAVGAHNRLVRLRAQTLQQFAVVDAQFVRIWAWVQGSSPASVRDEDSAAERASSSLIEVWMACEAFAESLAQVRAQPLAAAPIQRVNIARVQLFKLLRQEKDIFLKDDTAWFSDPLQKKFERLKTQSWPMIVAYNQAVQTYNDAASQWPARWLAERFRFEPAAKLDSADPLA